MFKARELHLDRLCAVKILVASESATAKAHEPLRIEAIASDSLDHPNIVKMYDVGRGPHPLPTLFEIGRDGEI